MSPGPKSPSQGAQAPAAQAPVSSLPQPFFGISLPVSAPLLPSLPPAHQRARSPRTEGCVPGTRQALAGSCESDWPSSSGAVLSNFVLLLHGAASPWAPARCVRQTSRKCRGSHSPCTSCLGRGPWVSPVTPACRGGSPEPLAPGPGCLPSLSTWSRGRAQL